MPLIDWLRLSLTDGLGPVLTARLVERAGSASAAVEASVSLLRTIEGVGTSKASSIHASLVASHDVALKELERCERARAKVICLDDEIYPPLLRNIAGGAPPVLYMTGTIEPRDVHAVAIVGSRKCSVYGREMAEKFASGLAGVGVTVVSGGARGVDAHAHRGAMLPRDGRTIAVIGCGVDIAYPPEHAELFASISDGRGAVLSEFPLGTLPTPENFPRRNRLISGLTRGTLVVEADIRSGALITARYAADDHNRPVFAIPGRVDNPLSAGPHKLIRDGAILVERFSEVLDNLGPLPEAIVAPAQADPMHTPSLFEPEPSKSKVAGPALSATQQKIVDALDANPSSIDQLVERTGLEAAIILRELTMLSLRGTVKRVDGQSYARKA
ncbi:MAG: DNA-processing protein DprA [Tepidisphaeraceae bacterium]